MKNETNSISMTSNSEREVNLQKDYEEIIQKLEEETRNHIRIEQQFRLHIDALQEKIEEIEKNENKLKTELQLKIEICNDLKQKLKEVNEKYNKLILMKKFPTTEGSKSNINVMISKIPSDYIHINKEGESSSAV